MLFSAITYVQRINKKLCTHGMKSALKPCCTSVRWLLQFLNCEPAKRFSGTVINILTPPALNKKKPPNPDGGEKPEKKPGDHATSKKEINALRAMMQRTVRISERQKDDKNESTENTSDK
jgi:hypothetical protein